MITGMTEPPRSAADARAEVEARSAQVAAEREAAFREAYGDGTPGRWVLVASWVATAVFTVVALVATVAVGSADVVFVAVTAGLFAAGCLLFLVDMVLAAARSREASIGIGGLFFLSGSAPVVVRRHLLGSLGVQVVVALAVAAIGFVRIDDSRLNVLAFGILVPVIGLGACGYWAVRWGLFPDRDLRTAASADR